MPAHIGSCGFGMSHKAREERLTQQPHTQTGAKLVAGREVRRRDLRLFETMLPVVPVIHKPDAAKSCAVLGLEFDAEQRQLAQRMRHQALAASLVVWRLSGDGHSAGGLALP